MNVCGRGAQKDASESADREQPHEAEGIEHRRLEGNGAFVESEGPVVDLMAEGTATSMVSSEKISAA